jgi:hypothetical protein
MSISHASSRKKAATGRRFVAQRSLQNFQTAIGRILVFFLTIQPTAVTTNQPGSKAGNAKICHFLVSCLPHPSRVTGLGIRLMTYISFRMFPVFD